MTSMALNAKILVITAGGLLTLAFIFYVVSNAVTEWSKFGSEGYELKIGLWQSCETDPNIGQVCVGIICPHEGDTTNICSRLLAARAFVTLACIISGFSALLLFACVATGDNTRRILLIAGKALAFVCLVMGIIGIAVGINVTNDTNGEFGTQLSWGASAIIGVIAIVLNFCGAIVSVLIK